MKPILNLLARLVLVALAYYVGASIGFVLKFPHATPSVMWPPNALLTATLLLTKPSRWWMYLLAALPAHLAVEWPVLSPPALVLGLFLTNCGEALLGAGLVHWFSDRPDRFDTLRRVAVFVGGAAVAGPFFSTFLDAALVTSFRPESYGSVWLTRFPSNVLTELTITPTVVTIASVSYRRLRDVPLRRLVEGALLACGLLAVAMMAFGGSPDTTAVRLWSLHTPVVMLLPFLFWAATRFGPGGLSLCLLTTGLLAVGAGMREVGVFATPHRDDGLLALQIFLTGLSIPLLCLAGVLEERRRTSEALEERLGFEAMLARLSNAFVHVPSGEMDRAFDTWLKRVGELMGSESLALLEFSESGEEVLVRFWSATGQSAGPARLRSDEFPWAVRQLRREQTFTFSDPDDLPATAASERAFLRGRGVKSGIVLPLEAGGRVLGGLALVTLAHARPWSTELVDRLHLVGEVFSNALVRRETEDALRASEGLKSAILASLSSGVAVLDHNGMIVAVNETWAKRAGGSDLASANRAGVGDNYLVAWRRASVHVPRGREAMTGIQAVLDRGRDSFDLTYPGSGSTIGRWYQLSAVPLHSSEGGAVISHTDITEWKRAELDAQRSRGELAHFTRVSTMGALAASLAHELNQPLTGILSNAQAARRFLEVVPPDLDEIRAILADIVEDDKRAGEVIERLRELLRKGDSQVAALDLNAVVRDVVKLLGSDALIRSVQIHPVFTGHAPTVTGDRIQLQQVILNLLVNAMDAVAASPREDRVVMVETATLDGAMACVSVRDVGPGIPGGKHEEIFEPFYTTKPEGMGMGLSISRSIVEAHGGRIWVTDNPGGGATFLFSVPLADPRVV